uniref:Ribonuclease H1 N-terminal domain-containing protein n=1 Tax=Cucumis melo TaxID=3656 RepID=A0A9I9CTF5_CUCME
EHLGEVIPNALKLTEKLTFSDYSKTSWAFKVQDNLEITRTEKILVDNTWVAFHKKDRKHMIACLNGLSVYFGEKNQENRCYVLFSGTQPGIYKSWASVCAVTKGTKAHYKKYSTIEEAQAEADQYLKKGQYYIDPELREKTPEANNLESMKKIKESEKELMNLKKQVLKIEEQIMRLKDKIDQLEAENQHLRDQTFLPE